MLNLADRIAIRPVIVPRCTAVVANYALYILGNASATAEQTAWARGAIRNAGSVAEQVSWHVLSEQEYIDGGSDITEATLKTAVETALNNHFIAAV